MTLIPEGRIGKYLVYAAGEIILVVIGILIALAINNANQKRILRDKEQVYLVGLQNEFTTSKRKLQELIRVNREIMSGAKKLLAIQAGYQEIPSEKELSELLFSALAYDIAYNPNNSLLMEMINSGSMKDLSSDSLRIRLTTWVATMDDIARQEKDLLQQRENVLNLLRSEDYSIRTVMDQVGITPGELGLEPRMDATGNQELLKSRAFENNLLLFLFTSHQTEVSHYLPLMDELDGILSLLEGEIRD